MPRIKENRHRMCRKCQKEFEVRTNGGGIAYCSRECGREFNMRKHIEIRKTKPGYKEQLKELHYQRTYGVSASLKDELLAKQNNKCAICQGTPENPKNFHLDHCHKTNKIRGVLCFACNQALGSFKDSPDIIRNAIRYLNECDAS